MIAPLAVGIAYDIFDDSCTVAWLAAVTSYVTSQEHAATKRQAIIAAEGTTY